MRFGRALASCVLHALLPLLLLVAGVVAQPHAGAWSAALSIDAVGERALLCAQPPCARLGFVQLRNGHAWAAADVSRASLRLVRQLAGEHDVAHARSGLRLVSELHFGEARERDPGACAAVLGHAAAGVPPGDVLLLQRSQRCGFDFVPFREGDRVQLLIGDALVDEHVVDAHSVAADVGASAHDGGESIGISQHARARRLAGDGTAGVSGAAALLMPQSTQSLAAAFASFAVAGSGLQVQQAAPVNMQPTPSAPVVVAPRRTTESGVGELRSASAAGPAAPNVVLQQPAADAAGADDAASQAAYARLLADWNAQQVALKAALAQQAAAQTQVQRNLTAVLVQQYADDLLKNSTAWRDAASAESAFAVQTLESCETIIHKPVFIPGKFDPGGCEAPTLVPGTPPSYIKGTPGSWTPGRAAYFTPGYWTEKVEPQWVPGTPAVYKPGTKGTIVPGECKPPSYTKASIQPGWIEKNDCV